MTSRKCEVCYRRKSAEHDLFLAALPLDPIRCRKWVQAIGQQDLVHLPIEKLHKLKFVCGIHFAAEDFNKQRNRLLKHAVPKLHLNRQPLPDELFVDFPLHIGSQKSQREVLSDCTNIAQGQYLQSATETSAAEGDPTTSIAQSTGLFVEPEVEPIASTSSMVMENISTKVCKESIRKRNIGDSSSLLAGSASEEIFVHSHKRMRKSSERTNLTEREQKLLQRLKQAKDSLKTLAKSSINLDQLESNFMQNVLQDTLKNQNRKPHGKRWDMKNKISALAIFKRSPRTYRYLQKMLPLPSEKTLHRILKSIPMEPGINSKILENLSRKIENFSAGDKIFALLFDEMALKKRLIYNESTDKVEGFVDLGPGENMGRYPNIADHALVCMIQGIGRKIKQPLAYYFVEGTISSEKLTVIIKQLITSLKTVGITILTTVCDQGPTNVGAINLLKRFSGLPPETNYFLVEEEKVYIMYDIPHLFKSIRNNFYQAGQIIYDGKTGQWRHLIEAEEKNRNFLNFKKLNPTVVNPTYKIKMKVKYAAHALSNTMAAILKMMAWRHETQQKEINETAEIIEELDKLFDATNGPSSHKDVKKGIRENVSKKTNHVERWNHYLQHIETIKFVKSDSRLQLKHVRCINGYKISLKSLKDIWWELQNKGFRYLNLRQLNQDALENLFGVIRQHGVTNKNPTCAHFTAALKTTLVSGITASLSRGSNCIEDENKFVLDFKELFRNEKQSSKEKSMSLQEPEIEYPVISLPEPEILEKYENDLTQFENQPIVYVSGYVAAKVLQKNSCDSCKTCLKNEKPSIEDGLHVYVKLREWWQDKESLTYPSRELCETVAAAKNVFESEIVKDLHKQNIHNIAKLEMIVHCNMNWFNCAIHYSEISEMLFTTLSKLFIRKQCLILNNNVKKAENDFADSSKRAQQLGKEK